MSNFHLTLMDRMGVPWSTSATRRARSTSRACRSGGGRHPPGDNAGKAGRGGPRPPLGIAFEGDFGTRPDALLAVAMLNGLTAKTEARRISLSVSAPSLKAAQLADVSPASISGRVGAGHGGGVGAIPDGMIGMPGTDAAAASLLAATLSQSGPMARRSTSSACRRLLDTADNAVLVRNMLLAQHDGNATVVLAGAGDRAGAAAVPVWRRGRRSKPRSSSWWSPSARFRPGGRSVDRRRRGRGAQAVRRVADADRGGGHRGREAAPYPGASIEKDFAWSPAHPVARRLPRPQGRAVRRTGLGTGGRALRRASGRRATSRCRKPGTITVLDDGRTQFTPGADGRHRYLKVDPAQKDALSRSYTALVSAPPAPRPGRMRR